MEEGSHQRGPSRQSYHLGGNQSTEILPIINMDAGVQQMTSLVSTTASDMVTSNLISVPSELTDQTQWAIQSDNETIISFQSLPIQLQQLDPETQFAIRQNLVTDPNDPTQQSIITYDENGDAVVSKFDMSKIVDVGEISGNVFDLNREVPNDQESLLLLHQEQNDQTSSDPLVVPLESITQPSIQQGQSTSHPLPLGSNQILVFCRVSATLSTEVMQSIPDYETVIWTEIQTEPDVQMEMTDTSQCTVYGSIDTIVKLNNKLQELLNGKFARTFHVKEEKQTKDVQVECDILVPHISSRGRQVHQPSRYTGFYKDPISDRENDSDDLDNRRKPKRRYLRPQKSVDLEPELSKVPETISKPFKFACGQCSFKTARRSHMDKHLCLHENRNVQLLKCKQCTFVAIRRCHLNRHELQHHSTVVHSCDRCPFTTNQAFYLRRHKRLKHKVNKNYFTCPDCNFTTNQRVNYTRHLKLHVVAGEKQIFKCETCDYKTDVNTRFQRHMKDVHGDARPYLCDDCGKSFKRTDALKAHKITHLQRKDRNLPHVCEVCSKAFSSRAHLKEHEISHKKERPYLCHLCGASFKTPSVQKKHIATIHMHPRSFTCDVCNKSFNTRFTLSRHKRTHDNPPQVVTNVNYVNVADTIEQTDQSLVSDVIGENIGEPFDQSDALRQTYTPNETTTALFYLAETLTL